MDIKKPVALTDAYSGHPVIVSPGIVEVVERNIDGAQLHVWSRELIRVRESVLEVSALVYGEAPTVIGTNVRGDVMWCISLDRFAYAVGSADRGFHVKVHGTAVSGLNADKLSY